jgi:hypothetical protein
LIRWIPAFIDSAAAFVALGTTAFRIPSSWVLTPRATHSIGSGLLREPSAAHASHALRAQPMQA